MSILDDALPDLLTTARDMALEGHSSMLPYCIDRVLGKPKETRHIEGAIKQMVVTLEVPDEVVRMALATLAEVGALPSGIWGGADGRTRVPETIER